PDDARALYHEVQATIDATPDAEPVEQFRGNTEPVPAWKFVDIPVRLYDAVRELYPESKPPFRARPFDVQLIGGMVLAEHKYASGRSAVRGRDVYFGAIAEMKTGEGKTIVAPLACLLHAICGRQIHVVTVNSYLVRRDRYWTFPFFYHLGLTVGYIAPMHEMPEQLKKVAYTCDVVYGTTSEFGFDYLRDNMKLRVEDQVQKHRHFAIVDEVDSTLIDEARTPLIISGPAHEEAPRYQIANQLAAHLVKKQQPWAEANKAVENCKKRIKGLEGDIRTAREKDKIPALREELEKKKAELPALEDARDQHVKYFELEMDKKQVHLEHQGIAEAQRVAGVGSFYVGDNIDMPHLLEQALRAHAVYERDRDYVVKDGSVVIVDQFTGRLMVGRQWSDGLHQAVEAKENVQIKPETQTMATITIQNFFKLYERLAGMTGTADTEAQEFHDIYSMDVVVIPTNKPVVRSDYNDRIYLSQKDKWSSIVEEIKSFHDLGRPILVGTTSVEKSEMLSQRLTKKYGIKHEVLNAKQHEREANIIEDAGSLGAVMIATNMAGRGTDIKLRPFSREDLIDHWKRRAICPRDVNASMSDDEILDRVHRHLAVRELGLKKGEVESMDTGDVRRQLLEHWVEMHAYVDPKKIGSASDEELMAALDAAGNFLFHRLAIWSNSEEMGGLHVIGTERHESRRIDNQLRGRSGRQGDNGSSRFFISLEDDLMQMFAGEATLRVLSRLGMKEGDAIDSPMLTKAVERAQRKVEERNFEIRKNILEYDEVMDHQRGDFYGKRQQILEGRGLRTVVMEYIRESISDACDRYLSDDFVPTTLAEWVKNNLDISIEIERLRISDREGLFARIRHDAKEDLRSLISLTVGEFMNADTDPVDWDIQGLVGWAKHRFNVDLKPSEVRESTPASVTDSINEIAAEQIDQTDLTPLDTYLVEHYGERELCKWAKQKFLVEIKLEDLLEADTVPAAIDLVMSKAEARYRERELLYPVDHALEQTMAMMARDPNAAVQRLADWARFKYGLNWDASWVRVHTPQQWRDELMKGARDLDEAKIDSMADDLLKNASDDASLEQLLIERHGLLLEEKERGISDQNAKRQMLRDKLDRFFREEIRMFERFILLQVLDNAWKEHLYAMDQLRNAISFRSFAQQDPRIEFRREGRRQYDNMHVTIRDRVTDLIFKARMSGGGGLPASRFRGAQAAAPVSRGTGVTAPPRPANAAAAAAAGAGSAAGAAGGSIGANDNGGSDRSGISPMDAAAAVADRVQGGDDNSGVSRSEERAALLREARKQKMKK
ncbi:MAG: preprotein translocase subunit SecA, partial [Planctomycetota bacterium]